MRSRRSMRVGDWFNGLSILGIGVLIGVIVDMLFQLSGTAFWISAIGAPLIGGGVIFLGTIIDKLFDKLFPSGFKKPRTSKAKERKPFAILLSLPVGIVIGIIGAQFGLGDALF